MSTYTSTRRLSHPVHAQCIHCDHKTDRCTNPQSPHFGKFRRFDAKACEFAELAPEYADTWK